VSGDPGPPGPAPFAVLVTRGERVESVHRVHAAVVDTDGDTVEGWGSVDRLVFPRSAIKPMQALPLVETGAADAYRLEDAELALACASHNGEPRHVERVAGWLNRLGLDDGALECGGHLPRQEPVLIGFLRSGRPLGQVYNNCSGKHAGMLTHARHLGDAHRGYVLPDHPVQRRVLAAVAAMCGVDAEAMPLAVDGCSAPAPALPLAALAAGFARFATPEDLPAARAEACRRIGGAMMAEPYMLAGRDRLCTALIQATRGTVLAKTGAEGVYLAGLPGRGLGIALKAEDGTGRAAEVALVALLERYQALDERGRQALGSWFERRIGNVRGSIVGAMRAVPADAAAF